MLRRFVMLIMALLVCAALIPASASGPQLSIVSHEEEWSWNGGEKQMILYTVTNTGDEPVTDLTLALSEVSLPDGITFETAFEKKGIRLLGTRDRRPELTLKTLAAGASQDLAAVWTPSETLYGADSASLTLTVKGQSGEHAVTASNVLRVQRSNYEAAGDLRVFKEYTVHHLLLALSIITLVLLALACIRASRLRGAFRLADALDAADNKNHTEPQLNPSERTDGPA